MATGEPALIDFIRAEIRRRGPVTFAWFMEQALYHPQHGYYSSGRCAIGRRGDYFTNVSVGPLFGQLLAAQFSEMWDRLGRPDDFVIVEQGAHHGDFARDVLEAARDRTPEFFTAVRFCIIEPSPILQERQLNALGDFRTKIDWRKSLDHVAPFCGVHFSNELLDSMPVHLISKVAQASSLPPVGSQAGSLCYIGDWHERCVAESGDGFGFVTKPITDADLNRHLQKIPLPPAADYDTEVNLAALKWIETVAQKLARGYVLAVDYGYSREEFYAPRRTTGTLRSFARHRVNPSPLLEIGRADITAHVDWTSLVERAEHQGLRIAGFVDQHHFITGLVSALAPHEFADARSRRALQTLLHPEFLGTTFQFLALAKNVASAKQLSGFKFSRNRSI